MAVIEGIERRIVGGVQLAPGFCVLVQIDSAFVRIYTILAPRAARRAKVFGNQLEELMKTNHRITIEALAGIVLGALTIILSGNAAIA